MTMNIIILVMDLGTSVVAFFPGLFIGAFSSLLLLALLNSPVTIYNTEERELGAADAGKESLLLHKQVFVNARVFSKKTERRRVLGGYSKDPCDETYLQSKPIPGGPYLLLILVHSTPRALEMRNAIRSTWLSKNHKQKEFVGRFVIGIAGLAPGDLMVLACENKRHGDLLLLDITDSTKTTNDYSSSEKLLQSFMWAEENVNFLYIFKCTDTTFAILKKILSKLETRNHRDDIIWGFFAGGVQATKEGRLAEEKWFLCTHYLPYPQGGGYVISRGLITMLWTLSSELDHYRHDDIAVGLWLSPFSGIKREHDMKFNTGPFSRGCNNVYIVTHKETLQNMLKKSSSVEGNLPLCEKEFVARPSYQYNWTAPANRCCIRKSGIP